MITARDLMRPCPTVAETTTVAEIVARMAADPEYCYAVLDAHGELSGILTEGDLVRLLYESGHYDTPLHDVAQILFRHRRKQLPVAEGKRLVGVVRRVDLVKRVLG